MYDETLRYKIGITLIKGIGNNLAKNLIAYLGSAEAVFGEKQQNLAKIPGIGDVLSREIVKQDVLKRAEEEIEFIIKNKIQPFYFTDRDYPFRLKECPDSPIMIYTKGNCSLNDGKFIGVVGTRNATETGRENCKNLLPIWLAFNRILSLSAVWLMASILAPTKRRSNMSSRPSA